MGLNQLVTSGSVCLEDRRTWTGVNLGGGEAHLSFNVPVRFRVGTRSGCLEVGVWSPRDDREAGDTEKKNNVYVNMANMKRGVVVGKSCPLSLDLKKEVLSSPGRHKGNRTSGSSCNTASRSTARTCTSQTQGWTPRFPSGRFLIAPRDLVPRESLLFHVSITRLQCVFSF